jgi:hypothetical protein
MAGVNTICARDLEIGGSLALVDRVIGKARGTPLNGDAALIRASN